MEYTKEYAGVGKCIWLDSERYPDVQETPYNSDMGGKFCVAEFRRDIPLAGTVKQITLYVTGAAQYFLWNGNEFIGTGPAAAGGDFLVKKPLSWQYVNLYTLHPHKNEKTLRLYARVRLRPEIWTEYTPGRGTFLLAGKIVYEDGGIEEFGTDETWEARVDRRQPEIDVYNDDVVQDTWSNAAIVETAVRFPLSAIPNLVYTPVYADFFRELRTVRSGEIYFLDYARIHCAYLAVSATGACTLELGCSERGGVRYTEKVSFGKNGGTYRGMRMYSAGYMQVKIVCADENVQILPYLIDSRYPITAEGSLHTSDPALNTVYDVCKWTLSICRQSMHLDSPSHQELLACTGDYLVETDMTLFTFGDMRLAAQDIRRTADWLCENDGRMFHTSYSLMWVQWLHNVYMYTGDCNLIRYCAPALETLMKRFHGYIGQNGILEHAPDYMFIDWLEAEGYSMHHPPKALGQTVLCAFYYKALTEAVALAECMRDESDSAWWAEHAEVWTARAAAFRQAFQQLYDADTGMYIDGLSDDTAGEGEWKPANVSLRHFSRHANILAAMYGLCPDGERERLIRLCADPDTNMQQVQPYYMYFILKGVWDAGLFGEYGMRILDMWKPLVQTCSKGLQEGWFAPPAYSFDYSHAWGGTPAYHLPLALTGLRILEPGFRHITLTPKLWGLSHADVTFPTPYGQIRVSQCAGKEPEIVVPNGIQYEIVQ